MPGIVSNIPGYLTEFLQLLVYCAGAFTGFFADRIFGRRLIGGRFAGTALDVIVGAAVGLATLLLTRPMTEVVTGMLWDHDIRGSTYDLLANLYLAAMAALSAGLVLMLLRVLVRPKPIADTW